MRNHSYGNMFHPLVSFHANQTRFRVKGFARRLALNRRHRITRKWPIGIRKCTQRENLRSRREPTTNSTHIWHRAGIEPKPYWWEASVLATAPSLLPKVSLPRILFKWGVDLFTKFLERHPSGERDSVFVDRW